MPREHSACVITHNTDVLRHRRRSRRVSTTEVLSECKNNPVQPAWFERLSGNVERVMQALQVENVQITEGAVRGCVVSSSTGGTSHGSNPAMTGT